MHTRCVFARHIHGFGASGRARCRINPVIMNVLVAVFNVGWC